MNLNFLKGIDNQHIEASRLLWVLSVVAGIVYAGYDLLANKVFSIVEFGSGMGLLLAGGGGGSALKELAVASAKKTNAETDAVKEAQ
jgi:hypothetical protein